MTKKRLIRDKQWFFQYFPYHQLYMDNELFKGWVAINYLTDGETRFWEYEKSGPVPVCGKDMTWMTLIPDNASRSISAFFLPDRSIKAWYIDVIERTGIDEDGVLYFIDKYLDIILTSAGDVIVSDQDELDAAYASGELTTEQYQNAMAEGELIKKELGTDIKQTEQMCKLILDKAEELLVKDRFTIFLDIDGVLDVFNKNADIQKLLPDTVERLKNLVNRTKADVVIISDWRYGSRAAEIRQYLKEHPAIKRYVILADCLGDTYESDPELRKHLVFVDALTGLQDKDLLAACEIMNTLV